MLGWSAVSAPACARPAGNWGGRAGDQPRRLGCDPDETAREREMIDHPRLGRRTGRQRPGQASAASRAAPIAGSGSEPGIEGEARAEFGHFAPDLLFDRGIALGAVGGKPVHDLHDPVRDLTELGLPEAARGTRRRAQSDAAGDGRFFRVEGDAVLVDGDMRPSERRIGDVAGDFLGRRSTSIRCVSVPPVTMSSPPLMS